MTALRFFRRCTAFLLTLALVDGAVSLASPDRPQAFDQDFRLPDEAEMALMPQFVRHIEAQERAKILFVGSSPTYGVNVHDPANTFPAAFVRSLKARGKSDALVYNLSAKGLLLADQYFLIKRLVDDADWFILQLNYHTFSPTFLKETAMRHPELPDKLDVPVTAPEGAMAGIRPTPVWPLNAGIRAALRQTWTLYRERDRLAVDWLGKSPESWLFDRSHSPPAADDIHRPFLDLSPARQAVIVKRYAKHAHYHLEPGNSEWWFLREALRLVRSHGRRALVFMTPLNVQALDDEEAMDWGTYERNTGLLRRTVAEEGALWADFNRQAPVSSEHFFDISHTLDSGGRLVGERLLEVVWPHLEQGP